MYKIDVDGINNAYQVKNFYFGGQPDQTGLEYFIQAGVKRVYNLRSHGEADFSDEERFLKENNIEYIHLPILGPEGFDSEAVSELAKLGHSDEDEKVLIHCASGNRIGAWYIIYLIQNHQMKVEDARKEGEKAGMTNPGLFQAVASYLML